MAVARDLCRADGHDTEVVEAWQSLAPVAIVCRRCGASYRVHPDDARVDFPGFPRLADRRPDGRGE